jgi:hypothetical protein
MGKLADTSTNAGAARDIMKQTRSWIYAQLEAAVSKKKCRQSHAAGSASDIAAFIEGAG